MLEKGKISPRQVVELIFITIIATAILIVPAVTADKAGHDAWLAAFIGSLFGIVTLYLAIKLGNKFPDKTIYQYMESILGKYPGKLASLAYVWFFLHIAAIVVREFGDFMTTAIMVLTPLSFFAISIIALSALAVIRGLEVIARMNEFIIILFISFFLLVITLTFNNWQLINLLPFLTDGITPVFAAAAVPASWHGQIIALAVILPFMTRPKRAFACGSTAVICSALFLTLGIAGTLAIFGPEMTASFRFPFNLLVRTINLGKILTRFEVIVVATWVSSVFIKTSVFYYCAAMGIGQIFNLREYRPAVLPLGIIIASLSILLFKDVVELVDFLTNSWPLYSISLFSLGLPLLLLIVAIVREKVFGHSFQEDKDGV